jgi:two-component system, OmpR family, sensor kinase
MLVLALAGLFVYLRVSSELGRTLDDGLRSRADDLAALVRGREDRLPSLSVGRLVEGDESFSQILTPQGRVLDSSLAPGSGAALAPAEASRAASETVLIDRAVAGIEDEARILARPAQGPDGTLVVVAGASTEDRQEALAGLLGAFLVGAPLALLLASLLGYYLARRSLAPVEAMRRRAAEITLERSGERLPLPVSEDEVHRLGRTLNEMLDRLEASLERERVFVADASHELRTPLSVLRAELELAQRPGRSREEMSAALASASAEVDRLSQLAEDLLVLARSEGGRLPLRRERVDARELLTRVCKRFEGRAGRSGRRIVVEAPARVELTLDPLRVEQALGNLVDNAIRHGQGEIRLSATTMDGAVRIEVSDDGRGFPDAFAARAFERFTRADAGRTGAGAGLGLAIARAIARAHGGDAEIASGQGQGAAVRIELPQDAPQT